VLLSIVIDRNFVNKVCTQLGTLFYRATVLHSVAKCIRHTLTLSQNCCASSNGFYLSVLPILLAF